MRHFFLPHPDTHKKAHLLSNKALIVYILFFLTFNFGIHKISQVTPLGQQPQVLGVSTSITAKDLITLTNQERTKNGLPTLTESSQLDQAAAAKAQNMFAENYWAHYSPSGKDPWGFILAAGYKFSYAGENLAKNFHTAPDVVQAWMTSPSHRENMVNPHYTDIGMAVATGTLQGEETVLVVQEFGSPTGVIADAPKTPPAPPTPEKNINPQELPSTSNNQPIIEVPPTSTSQVLPISVPPTQPTFDVFSVSKNISLSLIVFMAMLLALDFVILKRRGVHRVSSHNWSHLALMAVAGSSLAVSQGGTILEGVATLVK